MILNIILITVLLFCLYRYFYHTIIVLAIWWQVLENIYIIGQTHFTGTCSFIVAILFFKKVLDKEIKIEHFPLWKPVLFLIICYAISLVCSANLKIGYVLVVLSIFTIPVVSFYAITKIKKIWSFLVINICVYSIIILTAGFIELRLGFNPVIRYLQSINLGDYSNEQREGYIRYGMYRCQSLFMWCSPYGVSCAFMAVMLLLMNYYKRDVFNKSFYILIGFLVFGMVTCGTRSVYFMFLILFMSFLTQLGANVKYLFLFSIVSIVIYSIFSSFVDEVADSLINIQSGGGSNIDMRVGQFEIAYNEFLKSPIWGNGYGSCARLTQQTYGLYGAESMIFFVLIDRGLLGVIASLYLLYSVVKYVKKINKYLCLLPIGLFVGKCSSLFPSIEETYYFFYLFVLIRAYKELKFQKQVVIYNYNK